MSIKDLPEETLRAIGEAWTKELIRKSKEK